MIRLLVKKFIKNNGETENKKVREHYGLLGGILGIVCNLIIFAIKISIALLINNMAVLSDAFDSLADVGSSAVSTISAKMSNKMPDREHPFGHGRFEYIAALIISFLIVLMGVQVGISSVSRIIEGNNKATFNPILTGILLIAVLIKLWMFAYNRYLGKKINSSVLIAASRDSISDVAVTSVIIISTIVGQYLLPNFPLDSVLGIIVAIIIIINGVSIALETINVLLGQKVDNATIQKIEVMLKDGKGVLGIHDLIVHDYGPGRKMASVHVEISEESNIVAAHEMIDALEKKISSELEIPIVIHMDPISEHCEITADLREKLTNIIAELNGDLRFHDLRITRGDNNINIIFDLVIPFASKSKKDAYIITISEALIALDSRYSTVIDIDYE